MHYDKREDESATSESDQSREHCVEEGGGGERKRRREIYFYDRNGDVLFLHDRIFFLFSWEGRVTERVRGRTQKVRIKTIYGRERRRTHANFMRRMHDGGQPGHSIFVTNPLLRAREISKAVGLE